tara:strand:- start:351 stop:527 length:177 start_codon:yes stop_codon:yes gene_type:complete
MDKKMNELWDYITEYGIATENEICLITSINGTNLNTFEDILYSRTGYRSLDQIKECEQ